MKWLPELLLVDGNRRRISLVIRIKLIDGIVLRLFYSRAMQMTRLCSPLDLIVYVFHLEHHGLRRLGRSRRQDHLACVIGAVLLALIYRVLSLLPAIHCSRCRLTRVATL